MITTKELREMQNDAKWTAEHVGAPGCELRKKAARRALVFEKLIELREHRFVYGSLASSVVCEADEFLLGPVSNAMRPEHCIGDKALGVEDDENAPDVWPGDAP